jgi:hypothetical protein
MNRTFTIDDIYVYILNWKKVTANARILQEQITPIVKNTYVINCDEHSVFDRNCIQLDDSHYYGSQHDHAIKHVPEGAILCIIVGDNIPGNNFEEIFQKAVVAFNTLEIGVYSPNDKRSPHRGRGALLKDALYDVPNTDCGFWFIHPAVVARLRSIDYNISKYGWGIDVITIKEARKQGRRVLRDYSVSTDQLDHICSYGAKGGEELYGGWHRIEALYNSMQ